MNQLENDRASIEHHYEIVVASLGEKLGKLVARRDPAAQFARSHLQTWRDAAQARLDAYRSALLSRDAARSEQEAAARELEAKRAELLAAFEKAIEPFARRDLEARQAYDAATAKAVLPRYSSLWAGNDPGDTSLIVEHAPALRGCENDGPGITNRCRDLAMAQRHRSPDEMVLAVVEECKYLGREGDELVRAAFAIRWQYFASANGL
jgi:hypothetical protein